MSNALQNGAERLAVSLKDDGLPVDMTDCWGEFIAADPGIKALVEYVEQNMALPLAAAALKTWETGE